MLPLSPSHSHASTGNTAAATIANPVVLLRLRPWRPRVSQSPKEPTNDGPQARARAPHVTRRLLLSDDDSDNNCLLAPPTKAKANHDEPKAWEQDPGRTARTPTNLSLDVDDVELAPASVQLTQTQTQEPNADEEHDAQVKQAHLSIRSSSTVLTFPERVRCRPVWHYTLTTPAHGSALRRC
eukprot:scaffold1061_cov213-Prasinococcus_capsulatus_cf.AAC.2